jgi:hypothetical protein
MTKSEFKALEKVLNNLGCLSQVGLSKEQLTQLNEAYRGVWNVLTENGQESLAGMALRLNIK